MAAVIFGIFFSVTGVVCLIVGMAGIRNKSLDLGADEWGPIGPAEGGVAVFFGYALTIAGIFLTIVGIALLIFRPE